MPNTWKTWALTALLLASLLLAACGEMPAGTDAAGQEQRVARDTEELSAVMTAEELQELDKLPKLRSADLSGSTCYAEMLAWGEAHPDVALRYTVPLPDGRVAANDWTELDFSALRPDQVPALAESLRWLPALRSVSLGGTGDNSLLPGDLDALRAACPDVSFSYSVRFRGAELPEGIGSLDFRDASAEEIEALLPWLGRFSAVTRVEFGENGDAAQPRLPWELVRAVREGLPRAELDCRFTLYGRELDLMTEELDFNHFKMDDQGALIKAVTVCMPRLARLDMDFCEVDDEHMAEIRDALPDTEVIWRIWFGTGYSVRTDVERILASNPDKAGELTPENTRSLQYCTKVRYLDLGHNSYLGTIDYCAYMPELEVVIVAMGDWTDVSPLANCPKLEYAEIQTSALNDLRPLTALKNLRHLNICYCFALHDMSPLLEMPALERLWIGCLTPVPLEQVEAYRAYAPNCEINVTTENPTEEGWRYLNRDEFGDIVVETRYELLRQQMEYDQAPWCYSYIENDPLYRAHGW